ncbi:MAG TPA: nuclear transport factor 2 family protein [Solirubrobacterales bacterium]|nr:nuclear transport factor 2 family protein [Solirubrobacterales bacterium]
MADNARLIQDLYEAMDRHDGEAMARLYQPDGRFSDPAFGELSGAEAGDMWRMLTGRAEDLSVELAEHSAQGDEGTARWIARYTFTRTGRPVVNDVRARFRFREGRIVEHRDSFPFWAWARQALGPPGLVLGLPPLNLLIRRQARADLSKFRGES